MRNASKKEMSGGFVKENFVNDQIFLDTWQSTERATV